MANELFNTVIVELEIHLGDILALGIATKAVRSLGYSEDYVTEEEMKEIRSQIGHARRVQTILVGVGRLVKFAARLLA